jgi:hypothetical protein
VQGTSRHAEMTVGVAERCGPGSAHFPPSKTSTSACFRGWWKVVPWWCWRTTTTIEVERVGSFSKEVEGSGDGEQLPPSKSSQRARFQGWWKLVVLGRAICGRPGLGTPADADKYYVILLYTVLISHGGGVRPKALKKFTNPM